MSCLCCRFQSRDRVIHMKIVWHSMTPFRDSEMRSGYANALEAHLGSVSRSDTEIEFMGTSIGEGNVYRSFKLLNEADLLENLLRLRDREDIDAVAVGNTFDPGVQQAREILDIPIAGLLETSLLVSHMLGEGIAIIAEGDKVASLIQETVRAYGLDTRVSGVYGLDRPDSDVSLELIHRAYGDDDEARETFFAEADRVMERAAEEGAEVAIPGGGILPMLFIDEGLRELHNVPIVDKLSVLIKMTETLVDLYDIGAVTTSRTAKYRPPPPDELADLLEAYDLS